MSNYQYLTAPSLDGTADTESYLDTDDYYDDTARQYNALPVDPYQFDEVLDITDSH